MTTLLPEQAQALRDLQRVCGELGIDFVIIGAVAIGVWMPDDRRLTEDVDVAVALDADAFTSLAERLTIRGWRRDARWEPRWLSAHGARVDLLPVGVRARQVQQIVWARAETVMRVVGYDHVFAHAVAHDLAAGLRVRVAPLVVLALLKIVSYLEDSARRRKDLSDLLIIMDRYEEGTERRFSNDVLDAGVQYDEAGALLLGQDLRALCRASEEAGDIRRFLRHVTDPDVYLAPDVGRGRLNYTDDESRGRRQLQALARGFGETSSSP